MYFGITKTSNPCMLKLDYFTGLLLMNFNLFWSKCHRNLKLIQFKYFSLYSNWISQAVKFLLFEWQWNLQRSKIIDYSTWLYWITWHNYPFVKILLSLFSFIKLYPGVRFFHPFPSTSHQQLNPFLIMQLVYWMLRKIRERKFSVLSFTLENENKRISLMVTKFSFPLDVCQRII